MPKVILPTARHDDSLEVDPGFANKVCLFIVVEDGTLEFIIVGRIVDIEAEFLIPVYGVSILLQKLHRSFTNHLGVCPPLLSVSVFLASFPSLMAQ